MSLPTKKDTIIHNLGKLTTCTVKFVGITKRDALVRGPRKDQTSETTIPDRYKNGLTKVTLAVAKIGTNYSFEVNKVREKEEKSTNFNSKGTYCHPISDNLVIWKHKDNDQKYLRVYPSLCEGRTLNVYFDSNGVEITKQEFEDADRMYMQKWTDPNAKKATTQESQGVEEIIIVNNYKIENIYFIEVNNEVVLNELTDQQVSILNR